MSSSHQQVAYEIDHGSIWINVGSSAKPRYWRVRRNGVTKLWKRDLFRYCIPVKAGMSVFAHITNDTHIGECDSNAAFICSFSDPNTIKRAA